MCQNPSFIYSGKGAHPLRIGISCNRCDQCRSHRINDYVGRCLAEAETSDWACTMTLTYAPRADLADKVLTPSHFQKLIKRLRNPDAETGMPGLKVRYLVAGEYGELRGRAHFHVILFGKGRAPQWPQRQRVNIKEWEHGHVYVDWVADHSSIRYVCKYLLKWEGQQSWVSMSKKPALGHEWFQRKAVETVEHGVLPRGFTYRPPGGKAHVEYLMTGATRRDYIARVVKEWEQRYGEIDQDTLSDWVRAAVDKHYWDKFVAECEASPQDAQKAAIEAFVEQQRPTERQIQKQMLDTNPESDFSLAQEISFNGETQKQNKGPQGRASAPRVKPGHSPSITHSRFLRNTARKDGDTDGTA